MFQSNIYNQNCQNMMNNVKGMNNPNMMYTPNMINNQNMMYTPNMNNNQNMMYTPNMINNQNMMYNQNMMNNYMNNMNKNNMMNFMNMWNVMGGNNNNNNNNNNNQLNLSNQSQKQTKNHVLNPEFNGIRFNIIFKTGTGNTTIMHVPCSAKVGDIIKEFFKVVGVVENENIQFIYNAGKIEKNKYELTAQNFGFSANSQVMVVDINDVIGAKKI